MGDAITFASFILDNQDQAVTAAIVACFVVAVMITTYQYKARMIKYVSHPRNALWFALIPLFAAGLILLAHQKWLPLPALLLITAIWLLYLIECVFSLRPVCLVRDEETLQRPLKTNKNEKRPHHSYRSRTLQKYKSYLDEGSAAEHIEFFQESNSNSTSHWKYFKARVQNIFTDADVKLEYQFLKAAYQYTVSDLDGAYKTLQAIDKHLLYPEEIETLDIERAEILSVLGDVNAAKEILGDPDHNLSKDPEVWIAYAFIFEGQGDIDRAFKCAQKGCALADLSNLPDWMKARVYNNYARFAIDAGNDKEAIQYLDIAWQKIRNSQDTEVLKTIGANRAIRKAIGGYSKEECFKDFDECKAKISAHSIINTIDLENCEITLTRQFGDDSRTYELIKDGYEELKDQLNIHQLESFKASTFRMLMNGCYRHDWFDPEISADLVHYMKLTVMERLNVFKEYMGIMSQNNFLTLRGIEPFKSLYKMIVSYYKTSAIGEINEELAKTESYCTYKRNNLVRLKLGVLRIIEGSEHIDKSKDIYLAQYKSLNDAGLKIEAINMLIMLMDECTSAYNVRVTFYPLDLGFILIPQWSGSLSDFQDMMLLTASKPKILDDNIHVNYQNYIVRPNVPITPTHVDVLRKYIGTALEEFDELKDHPFKADMSVELAQLLIRIGGHDDEAQRMIDYFEKTHLSPNQFSAWFRLDYLMIKKDLEQWQAQKRGSNKEM